MYETIKNDPNIEKGEYAIVLQKEDIKEENIESISLEAMIVDTIIKNNCSMKDAINIISENNKKIKKNDLKEASLNIKKLFDN